MARLSLSGWPDKYNDGTPRALQKKICSHVMKIFFFLMYDKVKVKVKVEN